MRFSILVFSALLFFPNILPGTEIILTSEIFLCPEDSFFSLRIVPSGNQISLEFKTTSDSLLTLSQTSEITHFCKTGIHFFTSELPLKSTVFSCSSILRTIGTRGNSSGTFQNPTYLCTDRMGRILVSDSGNDRIQIFDSAGNFVKQFGGFGVSLDEPESENEIANKSLPGRFNNPSGICSTTEYFIADSENHRVLKFDRFGNLLRRFGKYGNSRNDFDSPGDVACDSLKNIYVSDTGNHRIKKYDQNGYLLARIGNFGQARGQMIRPSGIETASEKLFVLDTGNRRIQAFDLNGGFLFSELLPDFIDPALARDVAFYSGFLILPLRDHLYIFSEKLQYLGTFQLQNSSELSGIAVFNDLIGVTDRINCCLLLLKPEKHEFFIRSENFL